MAAFTRQTRRLIAGLGLALSCACQSEREPPSTGTRRASIAAAAAAEAAPVAEPPLPRFVPGDAVRGKQLVAEFECHRCHEGTGLAAPPLAKNCVACHQQIADGEFKAAKAKLAEWRPRVQPYRDVPSLSSMGGRLRPDWVLDYLLHPHDLRPNLAQTMPRLNLTVEQARDIVTYLTAAPGAGAAPLTSSVTADAGQIAHGKQLMVERGCLSCHQMSGAGLNGPVSAGPAPRVLALAPDLRAVRHRSEPSVIARWLLDPSKVKHDAAMSSLSLGQQDARDLAAFVSFGELAPLPAPPAFARLPVLSRKVGFDEVDASVFAVTCRHCHTNPDLAGGDGGPGNTGGFGFKPRHIDFSTYQGIQSGGVDASGRRVSLFAKTNEGLPLLVAALVARALEERGRANEQVRGMPLGLPPLTPEQIQLVESWVDQGRPL